MGRRMGHSGLRAMLWVSIAGSGTVLFVAIAVIFEVTSYRTHLSAMNQRGETHAGELADRAALALSVGDTLQLRKAAGRIFEDDEVARVVVANADRDTVLCMERKSGGLRWWGSSAVSFHAPVRTVVNVDEDVFALESGRPRVTRSEEIGSVEVRMFPRQGLLATHGALALLLAVIALLVVVSGKQALERLLARVLRLSDAAVRVGKGDLEARVAEAAPAELGRLEAEFNRMVVAIGRSEQSIRAKHLELEAALQESKGLYETARLRSSQLRTLNALASRTTVLVDLPSLVAEIDGDWGSLLGGRVIALHVREESGWTEVASRAAEGQREPVREGKTGETRLDAIARSRVPTAAEVSAEDGGAGERPVRIFLPLHLEGRCLAVLEATVGGGHGIDGEDRELLDILASQLAATLELTSLNRSLEASLSELRLAQDVAVKTEKLRAIGEMASGMAHDFNNVLSAILGRMQLMEMRLDRGTLEPAEIRRSLSIVTQAARDGARTVQRLQQYTRGAQSTELTAVDLCRLVQQVLEMTSPRWRTAFEKDGKRINPQISTPGEAWAAAEEAGLREVLMNVVHNALDAMPDGGILDMSVRSSDARWVLSIGDTGVGMDPETQKRAFDPFFTTKGVKGNGLGLSIAAAFMKRIGGEIELQSAPGRGTCVRLGFRPWTEPVPQGPDPGPAAPAAKAQRALYCLAVDDNPTALHNLGQILEALGHRVVGLDTGAAACRALDAEPFDVVITDLGMPEVNGWDVAKIAAGLPAPPPVILCTGWGDGLDPREASERGVWRILHKPYTVHQIEALLREVPAKAESARDHAVGASS